MSNLMGDTKLNFYPTHTYEIYRILGTLGRISIGISEREELKQYLGKDKYNKIMVKAMDNDINPIDMLYDYILDVGDIDALRRYFNVSFGYSGNQTFTIADMFAGEGEWLKMFKTTILPEEISQGIYSSARLHLIANELESNRFEKVDSNEYIDEAYNKAFEDFNDIPEGSISLMLYNPPYGETNGIRNVKHYLQMILNKKLIFNSKGTGVNCNGKIVMVVRKDDLLDSLPLIVRYFEVDKDHLYKVHEEEYNKYKQFVVHASLRTDCYDYTILDDSIKIQNEVQELTDIINKDPEFDPRMYNMSIYNIPEVPYYEMIKNYKVVQESSYVISDLNNDNWGWIKEITGIETMDETRIKKPLAPKSGELANIIASGMINGEMEIDGKGKHIVAGGMKQKVYEENITEETSDGSEQLVKKKMLYSEPYLNILINENGKAKIKELSGGESE